MSLTQFISPGATLDFVFDWSDWLADGESISSRVVTVTGGITKDSDSLSSPNVTAWVTAPDAISEGTRVALACEITTSAARTDTRRIELTVKRR